MEFLLKLVLGFSFLLCCFCDTAPQQIMLALTGDSSKLAVSWVTVDKTATSMVKYGLSNTSLTMTSEGTSFHYYLPFYISPLIHFADMTHLQPDTRYFYQVGDDKGGWSAIYSFVMEPSKPPTPDRPLAIAVLADHGTTTNSQQVVDAMLKADQSLHFGFSILSGDVSYANGFQSVWDDYGNMVQPFSSHVPFMVAPGNHEAIELFISYDYRYNMPHNGYGNLYYSFNYQNVHVLVLNSESLNEFHWSAMYQFAKSDLESVNRKITPWVFVAFHHPFFCSNVAHNDSNWFMRIEYEDLFHDNKVDMILQGHVHAYERTYPMYNFQVDPTSTVYVTNGHGGNKEGLYPNWQIPSPSWSAYHDSSCYGFSTMEIFNSTHLHWKMIRASDSAVRDEFWLIRNR
jgi:hypothetical protein